MHEFTGGEGGESGRLVVVVGRRAVQDEVGEGRPLDEAGQGPGGCHASLAPAPPHPSLTVQKHSLSGSLPGQPRSRLSPCVMATGAGSRARRRSGGHRVTPAHTRRPSRHPFHRVGSNLSSRSRCRVPLKHRVAASPLGGNLPLSAARSS